MEIENFKSIGSIELEFAPLTLLVGPPASGKSNILDALAVLGYFKRLQRMGEEYDSPSQIESLNAIARFFNVDQLFRFHDYTRRIKMNVEDNGKSSEFIISYTEGRIHLELNGNEIDWEFKPSTDLVYYNNQKLEKRLEIIKEGIIFESRLYGFDRYGLGITSCGSDYCGFYKYLRKEKSSDAPRTILSELGSNAPVLTRVVNDLILEINDIMMNNLDEKIEVKVLKDGRVTVFDYDYEIESSSISDSIFRVLYYTMALKTAANYVKKYGLEGSFVLLLEEPEAHIFPYFIEILSRYIKNMTSIAYVVIATHNPLLISRLWDVVSDVRTYYTYRDRMGSTNIREVDLEKLARDLRTSDELLYMPAREVLENYTVKPVE